VASGDPIEPPKVDEVIKVAADSPDPTGSGSAGDSPRGIPLVPVAGAIALLATAGGWWLVGAKRAAVQAVTKPSWDIPQGGVRPPQ
jgi:hypothetical protein